MCYKMYFLCCIKSGMGYICGMAKMGRPKKKVADKRKDLIHFRVTADESKAIQAAAIAAGVSVSDLARKATLGAAKIPEGVGIEPHRRVTAES
jgi:hypothetical protein